MPSAPFAIPQQGEINGTPPFFPPQNEALNPVPAAPPQAEIGLYAHCDAPPETSSAVYPPASPQPFEALNDSAAAPQYTAPNSVPQTAATAAPLLSAPETVPAEPPRLGFCTSCGRRLFGDEDFCPYCGKTLYAAPQGNTAAYAAAQPAGEWTQSAPVSPKTGLTGFAKGWMIFVIIAYSAVIASNLTYLTNPNYARILLPPLLCVGAMIAGAALLLKAKPYGLWIMLAFSLALFLFNGSRYGNAMLVTGMGLPLLILTWVFTRKQISYGKRTKQ